MAAVSLTLGSNEYPLTVVDGTALTLSLSGPAGPAGPAGPNTVSTSTTTNLTGYIYGNGTTVGGATAATSAATANTLVLRNASGDASFGAINASSTIITTGDDATITTSGVGAYVSTFGADAFISTSGTNASISTSGSNADIFTVGDDATISTEGANASIITTGTDAYIATTGINSAIFTQGTNATIGTTGADAFITTSGINAAIRTFGNFGNITTSGTNAYITTSGINAPITTSGADAHIATYGAAAYIQSRATFKLFNGTYTTTLSHSPTANRAIAFPNDTGTVALINPSSGTQTFSGAQSFSSTTRPTSSGTGTPTANSLITLADGDSRYPRLYAFSRASSATTTANNTVATDINSLSLTINDAGTYKLTSFVSVTRANSAMGIKVGHIFSAANGTMSGASRFSNNNGYNLIIPSANTVFNTVVDLRQIAGGVNSQPAQLCHDHILVVTTAPVTVKYQFAQHTSDASNLTADIGNWMMLEKIN